MVVCGTFEELRHYCNLQIHCHSCHGYLCVASSRIVLSCAAHFRKNKLITAVVLIESCPFIFFMLVTTFML